MNKKEKTRSGSSRHKPKSNGQDRGIQFESALERSDNKLWSAHVRVPPAIIKRLGKENSRRVVCTLNGSKAYQTAILPFGNGISIVRVNKNLRDGLRIDFGETVRVTLKPDTSEYGLPLPAELKELFLQDEDGNRLFHSLTPGKQRTLLYIVDSVKSPEKRITRALVIVQHLKLTKGKINYRQLFTMLKSRMKSRLR